MFSNPAEQIIIIVLFFLLIIISGIFTLFNSALGLCRKSRLEKEIAVRSAAASGKRGAKRFKAVLEIIENPDSMKRTGERSLKLACRINSNILKVTALFFSSVFLVSVYL